MLDSIKGFYSSDSYRFIQTMADRQWLSIEDLDSFDIDERINCLIGNILNKKEKKIFKEFFLELTIP